MTPDERARAHDLRGLYGPGSEAWRLNREAILLLVAGPRALLLQIAHPLVAEGVDQHSDVPRRPVAAARRHAPELPDDRLRDDRGGAGRDRAGSTGSTRRRRAGARSGRGRRRPARSPIRGPRPGPRPVGPRDARRFDDGRRTTPGSSRSPRPGGPRSTRRRSPIGAGLRRSRRASCRPMSRRSTRTWRAMLSAAGPVHPTPDRPRTRPQAVLRPPLAPARGVGSAARLRAPVAAVLRSVPGPLVDWTMWPAVGLLPAGVRDGVRHPLGPARIGSGRLVVRRGPRSGGRGCHPTFRQMPAARAADRRVTGILPSMDEATTP